MTTVEHLVPKSEDPSLALEYENCFYACRFCNQARSTKPLVSAEGRLLNPSQDAWGGHFLATGDLLKPIADDADAEYTSRVYDLDNESRTARRERRRRLVADRLVLLDRLPQERRRLIELADDLYETHPDAALEATSEFVQLLADEKNARKDLGMYEALPADRATSCRCSPRPELGLPPAYEKQLILLEAPL